MKKTLSLLLLALGLMLIPTACEDDESGIGTGMQDPSTLYNGNYDTISGGDIKAWTIYDTNLLTSGYLTAMVGRYSDGVYGEVEAETYAQIGLSGTSINFCDFDIDSIVMTLVVNERYPDVTNSKTVRLVVEQLETAMHKDSAYHADDIIGVNGTQFLDSTFSIAPTDTTLHLRLNQQFRNLLRERSYESQEAFQNALKGIRIRLEKSSSDMNMYTFDMAKTNSGIKVFYTHDGIADSYSMLLGYVSTASPSTHFCHFSHSYSGQFLQLQQGVIDSIAGDSKLYLEPLGGTAIKFNINSYVEQFHRQHPRAVIHSAELLLPLSSDADGNPPDKIIAYKNLSSGSSLPINDLLSDYNGYDGSYHSDSNYFRIRITQHLQTLMCAGNDYGTTLYIDGRRSSGRRTILNGTATSNPIKIAFIYTE